MVAIKADLAWVREATVKPKQVFGWLVIAFILFYVIKDPTGAAHIIHDIGNFLTSVASGIANFFNSL
jgi:hypothetical protein